MSFYKIKKTDTNYIRALVKYCKDVPILTIENGSRKTATDVSEERYTLKDLPKLMENPEVIPWSEFVITCPEHYSAEHVIPPMDSHFFAGLKAAERKEEQAILDENILDAYFAHETYKGPKCYMLAPSMQSPLSESLALLLLKQVNDKHPITNAMLFGNLKTILFEVGSKFYYLRFGEQAEINNIGLMFDLDDGFRSYREEAKFDFLLNELNARFTSWKDGGYANDLFPLDQAGFIEAAQVRPIIPAPVVAMGLFAHAQIPSANETPQQDDREDLGLH